MLEEFTSAHQVPLCDPRHQKAQGEHEQDPHGRREEDNDAELVELHGQHDDQHDELNQHHGDKDNKLDKLLLLCHHPTAFLTDAFVFHPSNYLFINY